MSIRILQGDVMATLPQIPPGSVDVVCTSPPYWMLRSYLPKGHPLKPLELGSEPTPAAYVESMVKVFRLVRTAMADHAVCWLNIGDSYATGSGGNSPQPGVYSGQGIGNDQQGRAPVPDGMSAGSLCLIPQRLVIALSDDGWIVRSVVVWHKPAPMPASVAGWRWARCRVKVSEKRREPGAKHAARIEAGLVSNSNGLNIGHRNAPALESQWSDCPGCPKCEPHGGYVLRRGSWRPTSAWEPILMLAKGPGYFCDGEACKVPAAYGYRHHSGPMVSGTENGDGHRSTLGTVSGGGGPGSVANLRDVWTIAAESLRGVRIDRPGLEAADGAYDGTTRITSPDCPVHGDQPAPAPTARCDERSGGSPTHTSHTDDRPAPSPPPSPAPTGPTPDAGSAACSTGGPLPERSPSAKPRSRRSRKTAPAPETAPQGTSSEETPCRTERTEASPLFAGMRPDTLDHKTASDGSADCPSPQTPAGTADTASLPDEPSVSPVRKRCTCQYYKQKTEEVNHYAAFPSELVLRCLRAGTSARGYCPACGMPWCRVVETKFYGDCRAGRRDADAEEGKNEWRGTADVENYEPPKTLGWKQSCQCPEQEPRPGVVLDPFCGSGRTGLVARQLGLDFVGCELNPAYVEMAKRLLVADQPLFNQVDP